MKKGKKMVILERQVQHVYTDKWAELEQLDKEFNAVEARYGFPPKKRYQMMSGPDEMGTLIIERQWASLAAMEAAYEKLMLDPAYQSVNQKSSLILKDNRLELYTPLP
jgi:hypothetical protein